MRYLCILARIFFCFSAPACSKKSNPAPAAHTIRFTASGTAAFTAITSVIKSNATTSTPLDTKSVTMGSYECGTLLNSGDQVRLEIQTSGENSVNYSITDNGAVAIHVNSQEFGSFSKVTADYTVN